MAETYFKHANIFPAPLPEASATVNLSDQHRQAMRARLYGLRREKRAVLGTEVFKEPYGDEVAAPWMSITTSDYQPKKFSEIDLNPNEAAADLKSTHFRIEDPSISRKDAKESQSVSKTDFVAYPDAKRESLQRFVAQPYPVIYRDDAIRVEKSSIYKNDFHKKVVENVHNMAADRANMRSSHFTFGDDQSEDRYISVTRRNEVKKLSPDLFYETTNSNRRAAIKNEQAKRSNVLDTLDAEKVEWKSVQKSEFVDPTTRPEYKATSRLVDEGLRTTHFKLGVSHYDSSDVSTYNLDYAKAAAAARERQKIIKPQRPTSAEGIQIKWCDLPLTTARSVTNSEFLVHPSDQESKEFAKSVKKYASQTSIQFAHTGADADGKTPDDRLRSISKAHFAAPQGTDARQLARSKAPPPLKLWEPELVDQTSSISKSDYVDPMTLDPMRKQHFLQSKLELEESSGVLRMTNFSLGSEKVAQGTTYKDNFISQPSTSPHIIYKKPVESSVHSDRVIARYPDMMQTPKSSVYSDTFRQLELPEHVDRLGHHQGNQGGISLHQMGQSTAMAKESVTRSTYVLPECMVERRK